MRTLKRPSLGGTPSFGAVWVLGKSNGIRVLNVHGGARSRSHYTSAKGQTPAEAPYDGTLPVFPESRRCGLKSQTIGLRSGASDFIDGATSTICSSKALQTREARPTSHCGRQPAMAMD